MEKPRSLVQAGIVMWCLIAVSVLVAVIDRHYDAISSDAFWTLLLSTALYAVLPYKIGQGRDWARYCYAASVVLDAAVVLSGEAGSAPRLEFIIGIMSYPFDLWVVWTLFRNENATWFRQAPAK